MGTHRVTCTYTYVIRTSQSEYVIYEYELLPSPTSRMRWTKSRRCTGVSPRPPRAGSAASRALKAAVLRLCSSRSYSSMPESTKGVGVHQRGASVRSDGRGAACVSACAGSSTGAGGGVPGRLTGGRLASSSRLAAHETERRERTNRMLGVGQQAYRLGAHAGPNDM